MLEEKVFLIIEEDNAMSISSYNFVKSQRK